MTLKTTSYATPEQKRRKRLPSDEIAELGKRYSELRKQWAVTGDEVLKAEMVAITKQLEGVESFGLPPKPAAAAAGGVPTVPPVSPITNDDVVAELGGRFAKLRQEWAKTGDIALQTEMDSIVQQLEGITNWGMPEGESTLRDLGATEQDLDEIIGADQRQTNLETLLAKTFPDFTPESFVDLVETSPETFIDSLRTGGRTKEKQDLLRLMGMGWKDIGQVFAVQKLVAPVDGIKKLVTFDTTTNRAFDDKGKFLGAYDPITREIRSLTFGEQIRGFKNAWSLASIGAWERTKQFALQMIPSIIFRDMTPLERKIQGAEWADETNKRNKQLRDAWRAKGAEEQEKYEDWLRANPKLQPRPDYEEGASVHPELWKDPWWWAYEVASVTPASVTAMAVGAVATGLTGGNWIAGAAAAGATFYPQEVIGVRDDLLAEGIPEDQVDEIALIAGVPIVMMESAGRLPLMWGVSPTLKRLFRREATKQLVRLTKRELVKRGIVTFTGNQFGETMTEVIQEAIGNAAVKIAGASRSLFENLDVIAAKTFAGVSPISLFGGMGAMVRVSPSQTKGLSNAEMKAKGWVQDIKTNNWYEQAKIAPEAKAPEVVAPEAVKPEVIPEKVTPAPEITRELGLNFQGQATPWLENKIIEVVPKLKRPQQGEAWTIALRDIPEGLGEELLRLGGAKSQSMLRFGVRLKDGRTYRIDIRPGGLLPQLIVEEPAIPKAEPVVTPAPAITAEERLQQFAIKKDPISAARQLGYEVHKLSPKDTVDAGAYSEGYRYRLSKPREGQPYPDIVMAKNEKEIGDYLVRQRAIPKAEAVPEAPVARPEPAEAVAEEVAPRLSSIPEETTLPMPDAVNVSEDRVVRPPPPPKEPPPPEPSPTHPSQPAPIEAGKIVMPDLQPSQQVVDLYSKPDFWRRVANLPLVKKAVGLFNPAAVANDPAKQAIILRAALKDEGAQKAQAVMSYVWEIGTQERVWGKTDDMGLLTSEPFTGISIDDIRQNPSKFSMRMTEKQKEWIKRASEIEKVKLDALKRNGIEINELSFEDGGEYAGRRVMGKFNDSGELIESGRIGVGGRVGAKQAFEKTRVFKEASDGIAAGYRYMNSDEALYYNTLGAYFKIADRQMAEWVLTKVDWRTTKAPEVLVLQAESARLRLRKAQQLLAALNRAVRGERVPANTINSIASVYADQTDTLKNLIPELQKPSPETADIVRILDSEAKALISEAKLEYAQAVDKRARAREEAMRVKYEEASIAHPAFAGKIFTGVEAKEIADILRRGLQPQFIEALVAVNKVNAIGRFFMLAGDASPMAIQLQFLAFYRPKAYAKAMGGFVRAMFDPEFQYRYYANNRDLINKHPTLILSGRGTEFTEFMGRGGLGKKLGVLAKPLVPFQKAFEGSLDVAGIELAKSLDHLATNPQRTLEVDQFINEFRGITSSARIGVSSTQRQVETASILAPRYNRAIAAYLFDIAHGGLRGKLARMSLAQGFAGLAAMAVAVSIALGEDDDEIGEHFNNESPKFFTWDVMGVKIGLGGKVRSILKAFGNMTRTGEIGQPAVNFLRGNLSPGASTGLDLLTGKNYIGEPTRDNVLDFTKTVGRNFMMIWTQNFLLEGGTLKDKAIIATAEFLGLRGYDISAKKELKIKDLEDRLGEQVGKTPVLTKKKPDIYDTRNIFSDVKRILQNIPPEDVLADKGYAGWGHLVIKIEQSEANTLPNIAFKDYNFDKTKGDTLDSYMAQWAERQRIKEAGERAEYTRVKIVEGKEERTIFKGLEALNAHKVDYPNAQRGNLSKRERELLLEYNMAVNKKQFIEDHPEIKTNRRAEWLKSHPRENAELALVKQANILTKEAYTQFKAMVKELDIPDSALPEMTLPPEGSIDNYFKYQDMKTDNKEQSWEADLMLAKDPDLLKFLGLTPTKTPIASLEIKTIPEYHETWNKLKKEDDPDYVGNLDDKIKDKDGLTAKDRAIAELKATKIGDMTWIDLDRKIEAIEKGTEKAPTAEPIIMNHLAYMKLQDKEGVGSSSAEVMLYRVDNPEYNKWRQDADIWGDKALKPVDRSKIPGWRIDVKYAKEDAEYQAILDKNEGREESAATKAYLDAHPEYRQDRRRRKAYGLSNSKTGYKFPTTEVENFVAYNELSIKGKRRDRFLIENIGFANALYDAGQIADLPDPAKVPAVQFDDIYDQFPDQFDEIEGNGKPESEWFEPNEKKRKARDKELRFDDTGKLTEFGLAETRREAYGLFVPEDFIEDYVSYYTIIKEGKPKDYPESLPYWEDDWFMMEHPEFYKEVYLNKDFFPDHKRKDYRNVPTREVGAERLRYALRRIRWPGPPPSERFRKEVEAGEAEFEERLTGLRR